MKMQKMRIENSFHGTAVEFRPRPDGTISAATMRRISRALCPVSGCSCGGSRPGDAGRLIGFEPDGSWPPSAQDYKVWAE